MEFSELVEAWLAFTKMTQVALSEETGIAEPKLTALKKPAANPEWQTINRLAKGFGVDVATFVAGPPRSDRKVDSDDPPVERHPVLDELLSNIERADSWEAGIAHAIRILAATLEDHSALGRTSRAPEGTRSGTDSNS